MISDSCVRHRVFRNHDLRVRSPGSSPSGRRGTIMEPMTTTGMQPLTLAAMCAGDLLNPRLPVVGRLGPLPADWIATREVEPVETHHHSERIKKQWVVERNQVDPSQVPIGCQTVWAWRCEFGHVWVQQIKYRMVGPDCPRCADRSAAHEQRRDKPEEAIGRVPSTPDFPSQAELRAALKACDGKLSTKMTWECHSEFKHPHRPYTRSVSEVLFMHLGCPECWKRQHFMPPPEVHVGDAFYSFIDHPGSPQETKIKRALMRHLPVDGTVNAIRIEDDFFGKPMVHPDVLCPSIKLAVEYDGAVENHLNPSSRAKDAVKDSLLRDAGWEVIRICGKGVKPLSDHDLEVQQGESIADIAKRVAQTASSLRPALATV